MRILSMPEMLNRKSHNKIVIFGSGYSINWISEKQWGIIEADYDTIGFNWYCKSKRPTTWYLIREQCTTAKRIEKGHDLEDIVELMAYFTSSTKIIKNMNYRGDNFQWARNLDLFNGEGYIFREIPGGCSAKSFKDDIFDEGIHHGKSTIYDVLHFCIGMKYEEILFCGVDLYNNRHFYLGYDEPTELLVKEGIHVTEPHKTLKKTLSIVESVKNTYPIRMYVQDERSMLSQIIPVWTIE